MNNTIIKQVDYLRSSNVQQTRENIIKVKLQNCHYFLTKYRNSRRQNESGKIITFHQNMINKIISPLGKSDFDRAVQDIMLIEARAGFHYWKSINIICKQGDGWKRTYPHAKDSLNLSLNIGYKYLTKICKESLVSAKLALSLGILHSPSLEESLVYDFMEIWRQTVVDSVIIPMFTRRDNECNPPYIIFKIQQKLLKKHLYLGQMVPLVNIIKKEAYELRNAIESNFPWEPFRTQWGNSMKKPAPRKKPANVGFADQSVVGSELQEVPHLLTL